MSTKSSGTAELEIQVTNPISQTLTVHQTPIDGTLVQVMFQPSLAGLYQVVVTYGGVAVKGSPLALGVGPVGPTPPPRAVGKGLEVARLGEKASFSVSSVVLPRVSIEAVEGNIEANIQNTKPGEYTISYTPKWIGIYDVIISIGPNEVRLHQNVMLVILKHFLLVTWITFSPCYCKPCCCPTYRWLDTIS